MMMKQHFKSVLLESILFIHIVLFYIIGMLRNCMEGGGVKIFDYNLKHFQIEAFT